MIGVVKAAIKSVLSQLFNDGSLAIPITYKLHQGVSHDSTLGRNVTAFQDSTIAAIDVRKETNYVPQSQLPFNIERVSYLVRAEDCPSGMSARDKIVVGGVSYQISQVRDYFGLAYGLVVSGEG